MYIEFWHNAGCFIIGTEAFHRPQIPLIFSQTRQENGRHHSHKRPSLSIGTPHPLWQNVNSAFFDIKKAITKAKLITKTYTLQINKARFNKYKVDPTCPVCGTDVETLEHFILHCPSLQRERMYNLEKIGEFIAEISDRNTWTYITADDFRAVRFILDASNFIDVLPALKQTPNLHHIEHLTVKKCTMPSF